MIETSCPKCKASFELGDEFLGATVQCGACGAPFEVVDASAAALPDLSITCPGCKTVHQVPGNGRGAEAECMICGITFQIPLEGDLGIAKGGVPAIPAAAAGAPGAAPAQKIDYKNTSTIRLSKSSLSNTMQGKPKLAAAAAVPKPGFRPPAAPPRPPSAAPVAAPAARPPAATPAAAAPAVTAPAVSAATPAVPPPVKGKTGTGGLAVPKLSRSITPVSTLGLGMEAEESPLASREFKIPIPVLELILFTIPVLMIPVTAVLCALILNVVAIMLGLTVGVVCWGLAAYRLFVASQLRNGVVVTTKRAVVVQHEKPAAEVRFEK